MKAEVSDILFNAKNSSAIFSQYNQEDVDRIVRAVFLAAFDNRVRLAEMAVEETGIGIVKDKIIKNVVATKYVYDDIKNMKTVGIINEDENKGVIEIAQPLGPIFGIIPVTNPTSTTIFKILISLKTRNPIIIHPHRLAAKCTEEAARICYEAAMEENAPDDCIQWISGLSRDDKADMMSHDHVALILATGGTGLVKAAYSSGTPALGVGAGNVPVFIDSSADIDFAVGQILASKLFDNGTICASEQAVVTEKDISGQVINTFKEKGAYFLNDDEIKKIEQVAFDNEKNAMKIDVVGKSVSHIAGLANINIPEGTRILIAKLDKVGYDVPLSNEILAPILAFYVENSFDEAVNRCIELNYHGGIGHTASIFSNNDDTIKKFAFLMNAGRIVVNMPSSQGAVGVFSGLNPSFTLGCGTGGKNITTDNITASHLLNIQRIARRREDFLHLRFDDSKYFDQSYKAKDLENEFFKNI